MKVLVIGTGAIGGFYGSLLAKAGASVSVLARSDYGHVKAHGIAITSETKLGRWHFTPAQVVRSASELTEKPDVILLCIKVVEGADRASLIRDALGPESAIVLLSNGVEIEDDIAAAFPEHELISGLAFICAREHVGPDSLGPQLKKAFGGTYIANEGFTQEGAEQAIASGVADAVAFGKLFIANPDLPKRFAHMAPLNAWDGSTFYSGGAKGYTDYPALKQDVVTA